MPHTLSGFVIDTKSPGYSAHAIEVYQRGMAMKLGNPGICDVLLTYAGKDGSACKTAQIVRENRNWNPDAESRKRLAIDLGVDQVVIVDGGAARAAALRKENTLPSLQQLIGATADDLCHLEGLRRS